MTAASSSAASAAPASGTAYGARGAPSVIGMAASFGTTACSALALGHAASTFGSATAFDPAVAEFGQADVASGKAAATPTAGAAADTAGAAHILSADAMGMLRIQRIGFPCGGLPYRLHIFIYFSSFFNFITTITMTSRKSTASSGPDQPPAAKRPCIADDAGDGNGEPTLLKTLTILAENGWTGAQELGRIEQTCKSSTISEDVWKAFCCYTWPCTTHVKSARVFKVFGGYRGWCRYKSNRPQVELEPGPLPAPTIHAKDLRFIVDIFVGGKPVFGSFVPVGKGFCDNGMCGIRLKKPVELGKAKCWAEKRCGCGRQCLARLNGGVRADTSLVRKTDGVNIKSSRDEAFYPLEQIGFDVNPIGDPTLGRFERKSDQSAAALIASQVDPDGGGNTPRPYNYDQVGLAFRQTHTASEIKRRVGHKPVDIQVVLGLDLLPPGDKFGITTCVFSIVYGILVSRSEERGDRIRWWPLCDDEAREKFGITILHILEQLQGTEYFDSR